MIYVFFDATGRIMHVVMATLEADEDPRIEEADRLLEHLRRWGAVRYEATGATWDWQSTLAEVVKTYDEARERQGDRDRQDDLEETTRAKIERERAEVYDYNHREEG